MRLLISNIFELVFVSKLNTNADICALLDQCLNNNVFSFGDSYYRQKLGIAMGNPCAPPLAIIFLDRFEQQALGNAALKPEFLVRYIDDYAGIWIHGEEALLGFVDYLNSIHPNQGRRHGFLSGGVGFLVFTRWVGFFLPHFPVLCVRMYVCACNKSARSAAKFGITY